MATIEVQPRPTPEERADTAVEVEVDEDLSVFAATLEDWVTPRQPWEFTLHEGTDFGRTNNIEGRLLFASGDLMSTFSFRVDQIAPRPMVQAVAEAEVAVAAKRAESGLEGSDGA